MLTCESGSCMAYVSFSEPRPTHGKNDLSTRNSLFELLFPPKSEPCTKEAFERTVSTFKESSHFLVRTCKGLMMNSEKSFLKQEIYIGLYGFKSVATSITIKMNPASDHLKKNAVFPKRITNPNTQPINFSEFLGNEEDESSEEESEFRDSQAGSRRGKLTYSNAWFQRTLKDSKKASIISQNIQIAKLSKNYEAVKGRLFSLIHDTRAKVAQEKKKDIADTKVHRIVAKEEQRVQSIKEKEQFFINSMRLMLKVKRDQSWLKVLYVYKVLRFVRDRILRKGAKANSNFDILFKNLRMMTFSQNIKKKIQTQGGVKSKDLQYFGLTVLLKTKLTGQYMREKQAKKSLCGFFLAFYEQELLLERFNAQVFQIRMKRHFCYKVERVEWYQTKWAAYQLDIIEFAKQNKFKFAAKLEEELDYFKNKKLEAFQKEVLSLVFDIEYYKFMQKRMVVIKETDPDSPYLSDGDRLLKSLEKRPHYSLIRKAEAMTYSTAGYDRFVPRKDKKRNQGLALGYASENRHDEEALGQLEKQGKLGALARVCQNWQKYFMVKKFMFKIEPSFLVNLIFCVYHLDADAELNSFVRKREKSNARSQLPVSQSQ